MKTEIQEIKRRHEAKSTEELLAVWMQNDAQTWSPEFFHAIHELLTDRGVDPQKELESRQTPLSPEAEDFLRHISTELKEAASQPDESDTPRSRAKRLCFTFMGIILLCLGIFLLIFWSDSKTICVTAIIATLCGGFMMSLGQKPDPFWKGLGKIADAIDSYKPKKDNTQQ